MVGFVREQHHGRLGKILQRQAVFPHHPQVGVQALRGGEQDVDGLRIAGLEVGDLPDLHPMPVHKDLRREEVFGGAGIQEDVPGLLDDGGEVHKEEKIPVALLIEIGDEPRHDQRLAAAGGHVEQHLAGALRAAGPLEVGDKVLKGRLLIGPQRHAGIQTVPDAGGKGLDGAVLPEVIELFV